ncbi:adenylate/guanylate cyclase domain-containing protein [Leucobacter luti]|uniref:Class 3 adenylate cyclase n=1 Tax=Leucobacter luti TaxID=340320 RepID=A0A4V3CXL4_9MICO|nr:adenylate/guanylate cyclase domain-containing protein [Leucobacter luti]QYM74682.1 HAMP domain-containing protein [Leucobacter luti]TDP90728.1 class 3 adenylate cyclase [Leucobacter luti]
MSDGSSTEVTHEMPGKKRKHLGGLSIQSKLLVMLLGVSLVSSIVVGAIGFVNGRQSLHEAAVDQLVTIRSMRATEIENAVRSFRLDASLQSRNLSAQTLSKEMNAGFAQLQSRPAVSEEEDEQLAAYYRDVFIPELEQRNTEAYGDRAFIPESNAGKYLQLQYTVQNQDFDADYDTLLRSNDAGDGTSYSAAAERYGDYFGRLIEQAGYEDALLLNTDGDVVFSAYKGAELGTNLNTGPYRETAFAEAYRTAMATNSVDTVVMTDYERWIPSLNVPAIWIVSPVGNDSGVTGAMAFQVSIDRINDVMTGEEHWKEQGLGDDGEVYLVGRDNLMRSNSRKLIEEPESYAQKAINGGNSPRVAQRIVDVGGTVLLQKVDTKAVDSAKLGKTGAIVGRDYIGGESITAYAPLDVEDVDWMIVARIDTSEAFAPVTTFTRNVLLSLLGILVAVSLLSLVLAQVFTRPIRRLVDATHRVAEGDLDVRVPEGSRDEFGGLGIAFNDMASSLQLKQDLIEEQRAENEKLLHTLMPESVAAKYKQGDEAISEAHENVSVVFAELVGFDENARGLSPEEEIRQLNTLMRGFDEAAEKAGVEKVRTLRGGYLASSGLVVPRVDNVRRSVEFAKSLIAVVERFNAQNRTSISVRAGVDMGTVTSGLVARTSLAYDLWGDAVSLAYRVRSVTDEPGVFVSQTVYTRTQEIFDYVEAGTIESRGERETVWKVV